MALNSAFGRVAGTGEVSPRSPRPRPPSGPAPRKPVGTTFTASAPIGGSPMLGVWLTGRARHPPAPTADDETS
jgi:hypothetical protein